MKLTKSALQKIVTDAVAAAVAAALRLANPKLPSMGNRGTSIRAAIRFGRSKSAVRRQFRLTDYEYRGHKATVTRQSNGS